MLHFRYSSRLGDAMVSKNTSIFKGISLCWKEKDTTETQKQITY